MRHQDLKRLLSFAGSWLWLCFLKLYKHYEQLLLTLIVALPLISFAFQGSIFNIVAISVERFFGVVNPLGSQTDPRSVWFYLLPVLVFAIGFNIPIALEYSLESVEVNGTSRLQLNETRLAQNEDYIYYKMW